MSQESPMITRRNFLKGTAAAAAPALLRAPAFLTMPAFLAQCSAYPRLAGSDGSDPIQNAKANGLTDPILAAMNVGITAPNSHNTQPWKFRILSPLEMLLFVDEGRILPVTDPPVRQVHISQGTFLELLSIGASSIGYAAQVEYFPEGTYESTQPGKKPVARVRLVKEQLPIDPLFEAIAVRHTNRAEYEGPLVSREEIERVQAAAQPRSEKPHAKTVSIHGDGMKPYLDLFFRAIERETLTYRTSDETRGWFRFSDREIQTKRDGLALPDQGVTGFTRWMVETFFLSADPAQFHDEGNNRLFLERYKAKIDSARALYFWHTDSNSLLDWVKTGRDYARFQLALMKAGLRMHPLSQVLQEYQEMNDLRSEFEKLSGFRAPGKVQMLVRIGRSNYQYFTPRRPLRDMIHS